MHSRVPRISVLIHELEYLHVIRFTHLAIGLVAVKLVQCCLFWHFLSCDVGAQAVELQEFPCQFTNSSILHVIRFIHLAIGLVAVKFVQCCLFWHFLSCDVGAQARSGGRVARIRYTLLPSATSKLKVPPQLCSKCTLSAPQRIPSPAMALSPH